jgi:predicted dehydrogenase
MLMNKVKDNSPIRVGMIGAGYACQLHSLAMQNINASSSDSRHHFELIRLIDCNIALAQQEARRWNWSDSAADWHKVTRNVDIDLVDVATPNESHYEICLDALANNKHVLCEKPLALNRHQALEMARHAKASGKVHLVNFTYRAWPAIIKARQLIQEKKLGHIHHFEGYFFQDHHHDQTIPLNWRFRKSLAGAGALSDIGSHIIDLARFLIGDIESVSATTQRIISQRTLRNDPSQHGDVDVDDFVTAQVRFENGAAGTIKASWALPGFKHDLSFTIFADKGVVHFSWKKNHELQVFDHIERFSTVNKSQGETLEKAYDEVFALSFHHFANAIRTNQSLTPNFIDGLRCCEIIDAILISAEEKRWVKVEKNII